ncbi:MAG: class I SAM-dependent methyltransferase [Candidatus Handelsmanbacteria bacterium]|nr:class I SAM-dependent methyltransferase [Candidatus Handelsmanbacteria bacterium]
MNRAIDWSEKGLLPDALIRWGIRRLLWERLQQEEAQDPEAFVSHLRSSALALHTQEANEQHYELPPAFFAQVLGRHLKYSSCLYETGAATLDEAEAVMLDLTCTRAGLADGQRVLELGCGWGSLTLCMAAHYPHSRITALSNSGPQREYIEARCRERGLANVQVLTGDFNHFEAPGRYDRVVSVEMFEHLRNWETALARVAGWLEPEGRLFIHVFCHRERAYLFGTDGPRDWMGRHFFTGGLMPSEGLLGRFDQHLEVEEWWSVNGRNYARTADDWLANLDHRRAGVLPVLAEHYGPEARRWLHRWRIFFMACSELFGYRGGEEWKVAHYRLRPR